MPRPLVFGDGERLIQIDDRGRIRDLSWPIGIWNHLSGRSVRVGFWIDGSFSWCEDWSISLAADGSSLWRGMDLEVRVLCGLVDGVFHRVFEIRNLGAAREIRWFQTQAPQIMESDIGDCVLLDRERGGLIHYKGPVALLFGVDQGGGEPQNPFPISGWGRGRGWGASGRQSDSDLRTPSPSPDGEGAGGGDASGRQSDSDLRTPSPSPDGEGAGDGAPLGVESGESDAPESAPSGSLPQPELGEGAGGPDQWSCGITGFAGMEGTWRDAEDGELAMNAIAQGSVDSTMRVSFHLDAGETKTLRTWIAFATNPLDFPHTTPHFDWTPNELPEIERHLAIMRTQIASTGGIMAANDSDIMETNRANYSYCWMRDGAHIGGTFLDAGDHSIAQHFIRFANECLRSSRPYFMQKYRADATVGASWHPWFNEDGVLPLQEDETASFVSLTCRMKALGHQVPDFGRLVDFLLEFRGEDGLPLPSYDLWEERRGIHIYTVATVIRALRDAGHAAEAEEMTTAMMARMWNPDTGGFARRIMPDGQMDWVCDSSSLFVGLLDVLPLEHEAVRRNVDYVERTLWVQSSRGGLARYEGDYYFRVTDRYPGNPWIIATLWLAQHRIKEGRPERAESILNWVRVQAAPTGVLPEQIHPDTGAPLSVSPLTWSHAEFVKTLLMLHSR